jgi:hypothetical protein
VRLEKFRDSNGSISLGRAAGDVLFAHFVGQIAGLSDRYEGWLAAYARRSQRTVVFCDMAAVRPSLFAPHIVLKPLLELLAPHDVTINVLCNSMLVVVGAQCTAALYKADVELMRVEQDFRALLLDATDRPSLPWGNCVDVPVVGLPAITSAPPPRRPY